MNLKNKLIDPMKVLTLEYGSHCAQIAHILLEKSPIYLSELKKKTHLRQQTLLFELKKLEKKRFVSISDLPEGKLITLLSRKIRFQGRKATQKITQKRPKSPEKSDEELPPGFENMFR